MAVKNSPSKKTKKLNQLLSVEGSRELEPRISPGTPSQHLKSSLMSPKYLILASLVLIVVILLVSLPVYYFYNQYTTSQKMKDPAAAAEEQVKALTNEVGKIIVLPTTEPPTIATVSDKSKLAGQQFFVHAENGDKVLIYSAAKKAILYRPSLQKIVEVGPINITGDAGNPNAKVAGASTSNTPTPSTAKVGLLNGTTVVGLTKKIEQSLTGKVPSAQVTVKENAVKNDYAQTLVIATSPTHKAIAEQLAQTLGGKVVSLPAGEVAPQGTDITVILGQNSAK